MRWYKFTDIPVLNIPILVKIKPNDWYDNLRYYVVVPRKYDNMIKYEEAGGEQYSWWDEDELEGWSPLSEIEKNEIWT